MPLQSTCMAGAVALGLLLGGAGNAFAQQEKAPASDNTKVNQRDRNKTEPSPSRRKRAARRALISEIILNRISSARSSMLRVEAMESPMS